MIKKIKKFICMLVVVILSSHRNYPVLSEIKFKN